MLIFNGFGRPSLTVEVVPQLQINALQVFQDDFAGDFAVNSVGFDNGTGFAVDAFQGFQSQPMDAVVNNQSIDAPLITRFDVSEVEANWTVIDQDQYGCLELEDELAAPLLLMIGSVQDPTSIPRYKQAGTTQDCDTSAFLPATNVFAHDATTGQIIAQGTTDGAGAFSIPVYQPGPHLIRAVNGVKTAISLPVIAEGA